MITNKYTGKKVTARDKAIEMISDALNDAQAQALEGITENQRYEIQAQLTELKRRMRESILKSRTRKGTP